MRFHGLPFSWARGIFLALAAATGVWAKGTSNCPEGAAWLAVFSTYNKFPVNTWVPSLDFRDISFTMIADIYVYDPVPGAWTCWLGNQGANANSGQLQLCLTSTQLRFGFYLNDLDVSFTLTAATWTRITGVYDAASSEQRLYVDEVLVGTRSATAFQGTDKENIQIGLKYDDPTSFDGKGETRNVYLYQVAIDAANIGICAGDPTTTTSSTSSATRTSSSATSITSSSSTTISTTSSATSITSSSSTASSTTSSATSITSSSSSATSITSSSSSSSSTTTSTSSISSTSRTSSSTSTLITVTSTTTSTVSMVVVTPGEVETVQQVTQSLLNASLQHVEKVVIVDGVGVASAVPFEASDFLPQVSANYVGRSGANVSAGLPMQLLNGSEGDRYLVFVSLDDAIVAEQAGQPESESGRKLQLLGSVDVSVVRSDGTQVPVSSEQPIFIRVSEPLAEPNAICAFLTAEGLWSRAGVRKATEDELRNALGEYYAPGLWCASTHLTIFAALLELALACSNVEVLSPHMLQRLQDSTWYRRTPGIMVISTMVCCTAIVLLAMVADRRVQAQHLWKQQFLLTAVPPARGPCLPCNPCHCSGKPSAAPAKDAKEVAGGDADMAFEPQGLWARTMHRTMTWAAEGRAATISLAAEGVLRGRSHAKRMGTKVVVRGVLQALAANLRVEESSLRGHVWNGQGWVQGSLAVAKSKRLAQLTANLDDELPQIFTSWGKRRWWRAALSFWACHPLVPMFYVCFHITSAKRAVIFSAFLSGSLALSALFMSTVGGTLDAASDLECPVDDSAWRFLMIGLASMVLNAGPRFFLFRLGQRPFALEARANSQWRAWLRDDAIFWLFAVALVGFYWLFICSFLANLLPTDDWKCMLCFATILVGKLFISPFCRMCFHLVCAEATLLVFPDVLAAPPPELGLHMDVKGEEPKEQNEVVRRKIVELANRGIRVRDLLDFYQKVLQEDFFDPERSTTHDVVRHAIIPWSLKSGEHDTDEVLVDLDQLTSSCGLSFTDSEPHELKGLAYASVVNNSQPVPALKMVTHGWGNIFRHLLAAVFADALGQETYDVTLELLDEPELKTMRSQLASMGKMDTPYWICAFSVNQHAGICGRVPEADTLGRRFTACSCAMPKFFTGDECEMNKFDDMIEYLREYNAQERKAGRETERFGQVVAIDLAFELFTRIWCVAELVQAEKLHLPQALKMHSLSSRERCLEKLRDLDVRKAQASYEADRDLVLGKIFDVEAFNDKLKDLLLMRLEGFLSEDLLTSFVNLEQLLTGAIDSL